MYSGIGTVSENTLKLKVLFEWSISGDILTDAVRVDGLVSPDFQFFGDSWFIRVVPKSTYCMGSIGVFLYRRNDANPPNPSIKITFGVKKEDGSLEQVEPIAFSRYGLNSGPCTLISYEDLVKRRSELLPSNILTVTCCMEMVKSDVSNVQNTDYAVDVGVQCKDTDFAALEMLSHNFEELLLSKKECDLTLQVMGQEFQAHRAILVARSDVFEAMFKHCSTEEETGVVIITDCDPGCFGNFLHYLYSGKFDHVTSDNAFNLYVTADKYHVEELKAFCIEYMKRNVIVGNVCQTACLADQYELVELKSAVQSFFNKKTEDILQSPEWLMFMAKSHRLANELLLKFVVSSGQPKRVTGKIE